MEQVLIQALLIIGMLMAFWMGYRAGKHEEKLIQMPMNLKLINTEEEKALETDEEIRENMKKAREMEENFLAGYGTER